MWQSEELKKHFETSSTISSSAIVVAEWNMNVPGNIVKAGNYRYRPYERIALPIAEQTKYSALQNEFDILDEGLFYTGATDSDISIDGGYTDSTANVPEIFKSKKDKESLLFSLEDCFGRFRPRSGINKLRYLATGNQYAHYANPDMFRRPRFYMAHKDDKFKYWTSYRTDGFVERGIATNTINQRHYIDDAAPFVVYKNAVPTNRIIVKMQTGIGSVDLGPFQNNSEQFDDPFFGEQNKSVPERWQIQYLDGSSWVPAITFTENSLRDGDLPVIGPDGYVEIGYGVKVPRLYKNSFRHLGDLLSSLALPIEAEFGDAYLVGATETSTGTYYVWNGTSYDSFVPEYGWELKEESSQDNRFLVSSLTSPPRFFNSKTSKFEYRELQYISGLRIVVETMTKYNSIFDLIEMSPRLAVDLTEKVSGYSISKPASDLGVSGLPVGQLLAGTGSLTMFDYDQAFLENNTSSIISGYMTQNFQIKFYEGIQNVNGNSYLIPIKTMYSEGFPSVDSNSRTVTLTLRDMYFYFEFMSAPQIFLSNVSLSYAVATLLDYIGFSNYVFKRLPNDPEIVIPSFIVEPEKSIAEILQDLAISTQSLMFFDEYNNFVIMSRNYAMPSESDRPIDITLSGNIDSGKNDIVQNERTLEKIADIIDVSSQSNTVFNNGTIQYSSRYIKRDYRITKLDGMTEMDQFWVYKPAILWEVSPPEQGRVKQNGASPSDGFSLAALPINADLSDELPYVSNNTIYNNIINFGESVYFLSRYNGYFYANGEIIRYDAIQYSIPGLTTGVDSEDGYTVWITSANEYEKYFSKIPFNGKMYPTGLVRIYTEPNYEKINGLTRLKNGKVAKHGRMQFGTGVRQIDGTLKPAYHNAGLNPYWSNNDNVRGIKMESKSLFSNNPFMSASVTIGQISITNNLATITCTYSHDFLVDDTVYVKDANPVTFTQSGQEVSIDINGEYIVKAISETTFSIELNSTEIYSTSPISIDNGKAMAYVTKYDNTPAGVSTSTAIRSTRNGIIKNYLSNSFISETDANRMYATQSGTVQSSALVFSGGTFLSEESPLDYVSYVYKNLSNKFKHFGTRVRIIGKPENDPNRSQTPVGVISYYQASEGTPEKSVSIGGASAGLAIMVDESKNTGYYLELAALTENNVESYTNSSEINDIIFYKILGSSNKAVPIKLWGAHLGVIANSGNFVGQARVAAEENPSVYDIAIEYEDIGSIRRFFIYVNNSLIQTIDDDAPLPIVNTMAPFIRGSSRAMFENIYALTSNYSQNSVVTNLPASSAFTKDPITTDDSFRKYAISGIIQSSYLSGISPAEPPAYDIFFEEFGTIMREAAYMNIKYDKAYPALLAKLVPVSSALKGYTVSGFMAGAYKAEFLIFNNTDQSINIGENGNNLQIQGVTFTSESQNEYTVDDYFTRRSDFSNPNIFSGELITSPEKEKQDFYDIKISRLTYGNNEFNLASPYIQTPEAAEDLMGWIVSKIMKPRISAGIKIFSNPMIQLGDIVSINYSAQGGVGLVAPQTARFIVYNIEHTRDSSGPEMIIYLSEVV